jgi:hypothetical protein
MASPYGRSRTLAERVWPASSMLVSGRCFPIRLTGGFGWTLVVWLHGRPIRYRAELVAALNEGLELLSDAMTASDAWLALSTRLGRAAERVGAVVYCLTEWPEPGEGGPDLSEGSRMRSRARFGDPH